MAKNDNFIFLFCGALVWSFVTPAPLAPRPGAGRHFQNKAVCRFE